MASGPAKLELDVISAGVVLQVPQPHHPEPATIGGRPAGLVVDVPVAARAACKQRFPASVARSTLHVQGAAESFACLVRRRRSECPFPSCSFHQHRLGFQPAAGTAKQPGVGIFLNVLKGSGKCGEALKALSF